MRWVLVADDVIGGFFAIDGGGIGFEQGKVCYFAPDRLAWENTNLGYSQFLVWCFQGDIAKYYETERWPNWRDDISGLPGDKAFTFEPPLSVDFGPIARRTRKIINVAEMYDRHIGRRN